MVPVENGGEEGKERVFGWFLRRPTRYTIVGNHVCGGGFGEDMEWERGGGRGT